MVTSYLSITERDRYPSIFLTFQNQFSIPIFMKARVRRHDLNGAEYYTIISSCGLVLFSIMLLLGSGRTCHRVSSTS
ncbi:hypothetical protein BDQ12DRAFT_687106 [Crucibulum laeve]|uniref:Uncharacterized protein n=1 Tax=Crucibulum laeve TaxID=68775 RepID=A0A5C3M551_9AGAR|nr:hypothetical protein BDQ12DRAFT_687106 [Crucibulum laeve]